MYTTTVVRTAYGGESYEHILVMPASADKSINVLILYFHGWGGDSDSASGFAFAEAATGQGYAVFMLQGTGPDGYRSWNGFGSTQSPGSEGEICAPESPEYCSKYPSCLNDCNPCTWTTCIDSVEMSMQALDTIQNQFPHFQTATLWATGCSNGAMFNYELAIDQRSASRFVGFAPIVGLPHAGFNRGTQSQHHFIGVWGTRDTTCPPFSDDDAFSDRTFDTAYNGWYYSSAQNTTNKWRRDGCFGTNDLLAPSLTPQVSGCLEAQPCPHGGPALRACIFDTTHVCDDPRQHTAILDFIAHLHTLNRAPGPSSGHKSNPKNSKHDQHAALFSLLIALVLLAFIAILVRMWMSFQLKKNLYHTSSSRHLALNSLELTSSSSTTELSAYSTQRSNIVIPSLQSSQQEKDLHDSALPSSSVAGRTRSFVGEDQKFEEVQLV